MVSVGAAGIGKTKDRGTEGDGCGRNLSDDAEGASSSSSGSLVMKTLHLPPAGALLLRDTATVHVVCAEGCRREGDRSIGEDCEVQAGWLAWQQEALWGGAGEAEGGCPKA